MGEVAEAEGVAAQVLEAAVDGRGGAVAGAGPIEVGQYVGSTALEGSTTLPSMTPVVACDWE